jgi:signal transduction histidine kinase
MKPPARRTLPFPGLWRPLGRRLGWKLFLSYLAVVVAGLIVLDASTEVRVLTVLAGDVLRLQALLGAGPDGPAPLAAAQLQTNVDRAIHEVLAVGTLAALLVAVGMSFFVARRIVRPIQTMMHASQRIAAGDYHQRLQVAGEDELSSLAIAFNRMAATLEQTEQRRLELVGDVAHELRTPLTGISNLLEGLADGVLPSEPATFWAARREVGRLQRLVQDLEELSRAEARQIPLEPRPVAVAALVQAAVARLQPQFDDKQVGLCVQIPAKLPLVRADAARLIQVLSNLLGNALHYTPPAGQVRVRAWSADDRVNIAVQDTGIGIAAEHLPQIFERFYRVDKSRSRAGGGSGIGLTIAKHLVEAHGGRIWANSPGLGRGSTFTFTLPLAS